MAKKHPRRLVIDADVARSAGSRRLRPRSATSARAVSVACHQFLNTVRDVGYHVVMTTNIRQEWLRHRSNFSATWLIQMYGRRQVHRHDAEHDEKLRNTNRISRVRQQEAGRREGCASHRGGARYGSFGSFSGREGARNISRGVPRRPGTEADRLGKSDAAGGRSDLLAAEWRAIRSAPAVGVRRVMGGLPQWWSGYGRWAVRRADWRFAAVRGGPSARRRVRRPWRR